MVLEAKKVSFGYKGDMRQILTDITFRAESHEIVGIRAASGRGKTTLCRLLSGYQRPDSGQVLLDGEPVWDGKGYCPVQLIGQHPEQSVNPRLRMREVIREGDRVDTGILSALGIEEAWMDRFPAELSGGELQRFCIARALGQRTRFLLCDEISTMLDLITQSQIWHFLLEESHRRQIGIIAVSHDPNLLERICTRVVDL